jgi:hypothetical protein
MRLNTTGLLVGNSGSPSANLQVMGNAIVTNRLTIGSSTSGSSNLNITGTMAFSSGNFLSSGNLGNNSVVFADSSAGDIDLQLPYASTVPGFVVTVKNIGSSNTVTVSHGGLIDGQPSAVRLTAGNSVFPFVSMLSSGNEYYILSSGPATNSTSIALEKITNCVVWLDASDTSTLTINGSGYVTAWADKSGRGLSFQQATVGSQPRMTNAWKNGKNAVAFDKEVQYLESTARLNYSLTGYTFFCVYDNATPAQPSGNTEGNSSLFAIYENTITTNPSFWFVTKSNGQTYPNTQHTGAVDVTDLVLTGVPMNTPLLATTWWSQALIKKYIVLSNGTNGTSTNANLALSLNASSAKARVGTQKTSVTYEPYGRSFSGNVGEILMYDRKLEDAEISVIQSYLTSKWSL